MKKHARRLSARRVGQTAQTIWFAIRVELVAGRGERYWPRPGRVFAAATSHSFAQLSTAIDDAFARWDRSHLHEFQLSDGTVIGIPSPESEDGEIVDETREHLARIRVAQPFIYVFDPGDDWIHLCNVVDTSVDPLDVLGAAPDAPLPYFGWGNIPDQYGRAWDEDDGESPMPPNPELKDSPTRLPGGDRNTRSRR